MPTKPAKAANASTFVEGVAQVFEGLGEWIRGAPPDREVVVVREGDLNEQININTVNQTNNTVYNVNPPSISPGTRVIYVPTSNGKQPSVEIDIDPPPKVPPRRLPKEADGQNETKTKGKKSISVAVAATDLKLGGLLHIPFTTKEIEIKQAKPVDLVGKVTEANKKSAKNFGLWLALQSGTMTEEDEEELEKLGGAIPIWDCTALITPQQLSGFGGKVGFFIGLEGLHSIAAELKRLKRNAFMEVTGFIPKKYKIKEDNSSVTRAYEEGKTSFDGKALVLTSSGISGLHSALGVDEFPISVPRSFVNHTDEELDKILDKKIQLLAQERERTDDAKLIKAIDAAIADCQAQKQGKSIYQVLNNLPQQTSWLARVLDEVLGSYPFSITLKDSDLIKLGDQEKTVKVPNVAEALAELTGLSIVNHAATELSVNFLIRVLTETGIGRMQTVKNYYLLDVIRDWLGVRTNDKTTEVQFAFDPTFTLEDDPNTSDEFAKFLTPKKVPVQIEEINENITLRKTVQKIEELHLMCKTYMTRKADSKEDLVKYVKEAAEALSGKGDQKEGDDFDEFLRLVETGGVNQPGNSLNNQPYGRDYDQRPRTRRISDKRGD